MHHASRIREAETRNAQIRHAQRVLELKPNAMIEALEEHSSLADLPFSVEGLETLFIDRRVVTVVDDWDLEDVPEQSVGQAIPIGKRQELYRETICSAAVRVAQEYLVVLPLEEVEVLLLADGGPVIFHPSRCFILRPLCRGFVLSICNARRQVPSSSVWAGISTGQRKTAFARSIPQRSVLNWLEASRTSFAAGAVLSLRFAQNLAQPGFERRQFSLIVLRQRRDHKFISMIRLPNLETPLSKADEFF